MKCRDYGFSSGGDGRNGVFRYRETAFDRRGHLFSMISKPERTINILDSPDLPSDYTEDQWYENAARLSPRELRVATMAGYSIEYAYLNRDADPANGVRVDVGGGIGGSLRNPAKVAESMELARQRNQRLVILNGLGASARTSVPPRPVVGRMVEDGRFQHGGQWLWPILKDTLAKYGDRIELLGSSADARWAIGLAAACAMTDESISDLTVVAPVGAVGRSMPNTQLHFGAQLPSMMAYGWQSPYRRRQTSSRSGKETDQWSKTMAGAGGDNVLRYPAALSRTGGLLSDLTVALSAVGRASVIQFEHDQFGSVDAMLGVMNQAVASSRTSEASVSHFTVKDHDHAVLSAQAGPEPRIRLYDIPRHASQN